MKKRKKYLEQEIIWEKFIIFVDNYKKVYNSNKIAEFIYSSKLTKRGNSALRSNFRNIENT
jgi:hypothetical protein